MFTGIVTHMGEVREITGEGEERSFLIHPGFAADSLEVGASVAHDGVCLTVTRIEGSLYEVRASGETLARTTLGGWRRGSTINLERSLRLGDELGGHLVFGHVDGIARVSVIEPSGASRIVRFAVAPGLLPLIAVKGSIALDGVSLTINEVDAQGFAVMIIPHTWDHTTLGGLQAGRAVNLEVDMLARYVARQIEMGAFVATQAGRG